MTLPPLDPALTPEPDANTERVQMLARMKAMTAEERADAVVDLRKRIDRASGPKKRLLQDELRRIVNAA